MVSFIAGRHVHRGFGVGIKRTVNDVGPFDQLRDRPRVEAKRVLCHVSDELGAGAIVGIVKLGIAQGALIVLSVRRRSETRSGGDRTTR